MLGDSVEIDAGSERFRPVGHKTCTGPKGERDDTQEPEARPHFVRAHARCDDEASAWNNKNVDPWTRAGKRATSDGQHRLVTVNGGQRLNNRWRGTCRWKSKTWK